MTLRQAKAEVRRLSGSYPLVIFIRGTQKESAALMLEISRIGLAESPMCVDLDARTDSGVLEQAIFELTGATPPVPHVFLKHHSLGNLARILELKETGKLGAVFELENLLGKCDNGGTEQAKRCGRIRRPSLSFPDLQALISAPQVSCTAPFPPSPSSGDDNFMIEHLGRYRVDTSSPH
jgi:hypothetical protein